LRTLLSRQINYALTAAPNFLQQFVVAEISRQVRDVLAPRGVLTFVNSRRVLVTPKRGEASLKKATRATSFRRIGRDFHAAL
jgi:hypothetical protein